jgi:hypothetical protein
MPPSPPFMSEPLQPLRNQQHRPRVLTVMKRHRMWLSLLLGLVLLVQGVAVSAAPDIASKSDTVAMTVGADMPCHGQMGDQASNDSASCCDAQCPDMTSCMLGHLALIAHFQLTTPHAPAELPGLIPIRILTRFPSSPLRPPIALHG